MTKASATFGFKDVDASAKAGLVRGVFDRVAKNYDLMNDVMSGGVHRLWKDAVAARLNPQPGEIIIDCAGGTGDMARRFAKMTRAAQERRGGPRRGDQHHRLQRRDDRRGDREGRRARDHLDGGRRPSACRCPTPMPTPM
jgi:hypothetical protein